MTLPKQPSIAIYVPEGGDTATGVNDDNVTFDGWCVIRNESHMLGKWATALEGMEDGVVLVPTMEAMQQLMSAGAWESPVGEDLAGRAMLFVSNGNLTPIQEQRIEEAQRNGYRVGVVVKQGEVVSSDLYAAGVAVYQEESLALDPLRTQYLLRELAYG